MGALLKSLGIDRLSVEERLTLVEDLWDGIAEESAAHLYPMPNARNSIAVSRTTPLTPMTSFLGKTLRPLLLHVCYACYGRK
jgi:hypothetical protein